MIPLTPTQKRCLEAIDRLTICGVPPSYRQLSDALGLRSVSCTHGLVQQLVERGYVRAGTGKARTIEVIARPSLSAHLSLLIDQNGVEAVERALAQAKQKRAA